jgi:SAM-dependent methyltransferase
MQSNTPDEIFFDPDIYEAQFAYASQFGDIPFWIDLARGFGPKVLELACGAGRITIPAFENGIDIEGIDFARRMLALAEQRARARSLPIHFHLGDLRALPFVNQFDLMFLPTGTISHLVTRSEVESFLAGARKGLRRNGVLAIDAHNPTRTFLKSWPVSPDPIETSFQRVSTGQTVKVRTTQEYAADSQVFTVHYRCTFPDMSERDAAIVLKMYFPVELESLLHYNGFDVLRKYGEYTRNEFNHECAKYVIVAQRHTL